ncbi:MAG: hypothetical protein ABIT83_25925 [Massilia sp.]
MTGSAADAGSWSSMTGAGCGAGSDTGAADGTAAGTAAGVGLITPFSCGAPQYGQKFTLRGIDLPHPALTHR